MITTTACFSCPASLTVNHTVGTVAPETKSVTYAVVLSNLSGADKCWITRNLGATNQASSATDATDASAGWYWQFNRKQGYKNGTPSPPTPAWTITSINENSDWLAANDPCTIELGTGWRIPTYTEWFNADANGGWVDYDNDATGTFGSVLKLHAAGCLEISLGALYLRGTYGIYSCSTQANPTSANQLYFNSSMSTVITDSKVYANALRCIRD